VVILLPIAQKYGLAGLLTASVMSGFFLLFFSAMRMGRLIIYIPIEVTQGFTLGIGILIATLQLKDFFGMQIESMPGEFYDKVVVLAENLPKLNWADTTVGLVSLIVVFGWPKLRHLFKGKMSLLFTKVPSHLPAIIFGMIAASIIVKATGDSSIIQTIGSKFHYTNPDGSIGNGIPPFLPTFALPWNLPGADGQPMQWNMEVFQHLLMASFSMAVLGAIESLLCAVILDGMTGTKHHSNSELLGQGIGNILAPFFGGITATAAIARSAANVRAGGTSPIASVIHALVVLLAILALAPFLSLLPLSSMAALLLMVAYNMSDLKGVNKTVRTVPKGDVLILIICVSLTVFFDMVVAIAFGCIMAAMMFMRSMAKLTIWVDQLKVHTTMREQVPEGWNIYKINGPLFFAAADRVFNDMIVSLNSTKGLILDVSSVNVLDAGGLSSFQHFAEDLRKAGVKLLVCELQYQPLKTLVRAKFEPVSGVVELSRTVEDAIERSHQM
jgi:SulP family sulfate permease